MTDQRIPSGPIERDPAGPFIDRDERSAMLREALGKVELGAYDRRILEWLAGWDTSTVLTVAGLLVRARRAEAAAVAGELAGLQRHRGADPHVLLTRPWDWPPGRR